MNSINNSENRKKKLELTQFLFQKASYKRVPISGTFELSPVCNFLCPMCYVRKTCSEVKQSDRGTFTAEEWLEIARQARESGMLYLLLTGGEPFLWEHFWELYEELAQMGFVISINTNGYLVDETVVAKLKKNPPLRLNITLYGASDETYLKMCGIQNGFTRVSRALELLKEAGIAVKLNCSMTPVNVSDLEKVVAYAKEMEFELQIATYMFPPIRRNPEQIGCNERFTPEEAAKAHLQYLRLYYGDEQFQGFRKEILKNKAPQQLPDDFVCGMKCRAGKSTFWITWDGWMTPCGMMPQPKIDMRKTCFADAWKETVKSTNEIIVSSTCAGCEKKEICHACAAMAYAETGSFNKVPKYLCKTVNAMKEIEIT